MLLLDLVASASQNIIKKQKLQKIQLMPESELGLVCTHSAAGQVSAIRSKMKIWGYINEDVFNKILVLVMLHGGASTVQ